MLGKKYYFYFVIIYLLSFCGIHNIAAQNISYSLKSYTTKDGLASNEVYSAFKDSKGKIWFATNNGVTMYNGSAFKSFNINNGLPDNTVFKITEDDKENIWIIPFSSNLAYIKNNKVCEFKHNDVLNKHYPRSSSVELNFIQDSMVVNPYQKGNITFYENGHKTKTPDTNSKTIVISCFTDISGKLKQLTSSINDKEKTIIIKHLLPNKKEDILFSSDTIEPTLFDRIIRIDNSTWVYTNKSRAYIFTKGRVIKILEFKDNILRVFYDQDGGLWFGLRINGLIRIPDYKKDVRQGIISNCSVSDILRDDENGYWITTLEKGVFYLPSIKISNLTLSTNELENFCLSITTDNNNIYTGSQLGNLYTVNTSTKTFSGNKTPGKSNSPISTALYDSVIDATWISSPDWGGYCKKGIYTDVKEAAAAISFFQDSNDLYCGHWSYLSLLPGNKKASRFNKSQIRFECIEKYITKELLIGSVDGLYKFNIVDSSFQKLKIFPDKEKQPRIVDIAKASDHWYYLATKGFGVIKWKENHPPQKLTETEGLINNNVKKIIPWERWIFLLSDNGISVLTTDSENWKIVDIIDDSRGLSNSTFNDFTISQNTLWLAGSKGIDIVDLSLLNYGSKATILIDELKISGKENEIKNFYETTFNQNSIQISYHFNTYQKNKRKHYKYRIIESDSTWTYTKQEELSFVSLTSGIHTFEIAASDGINWSEIKKITFKINPPFWATWWFALISFTIVLILFYLFLKQLFERRRIKMEDRYKMQQHVSELELKALRAQINPHFIFNVLYSIQHYIVSNQKEEAQSYLTKFARLLRNVLQNSEKSLITLEEEIRALQLYLELEEMRFDNKFEHVISTDEKLELDTTKIPTLLVQPIIENCIKHGMAHLKDKGKINISFKQENESLICEIEDNGVGRDYHKKSAKPFEEYQSMGLKITRDRIEIIGQQSHKNVKISIFDKSIETHGETGTKVIIELPLMY